MLEVLTGSELEQPERPCCSNVLLSCNCAMGNVCGPWGHLTVQCSGMVAMLPSRALICQSCNMPCQDPEQAKGESNCTSQG